MCIRDSFPDSAQGRETVRCSASQANRASFPSGEPYDTAVAAGTENSDLEAQISCSTGASSDRRAVYPVSYTHLDVYKRQVIN